MALDVFIASGTTVSSAVSIARPTFALYWPASASAGTVRVQFALSLDAASGAFATLQGANAVGPWIVGSGVGPQVSAPIPAITPFMRVSLGTATSFASSYTVLQLTQ